MPATTISPGAKSAYTTAGPFGLEDQVTTSGPGMTLIYHLVLPFFWCIPISLVAAELTTAMPVQGGFYRTGFYFPQITGWKHYLVSVAMVAVIAYINERD